jgi:hypothetical protein
MCLCKCEKKLSAAALYSIPSGLKGAGSSCIMSM